jgi:hypothetical protein
MLGRSLLKCVLVLIASVTSATRDPLPSSSAAIPSTERATGRQSDPLDALSGPPSSRFT